MNDGAEPGVSESSSQGDQFVVPEELMIGWVAAMGIELAPAEPVYPPHDDMLTVPGGGGEIGGGGGLCQLATIP
jgi:hypothetical protein